MPIYEYECLTNKHRFEVIQKFSDPPVSHCTVCGEPVQKLLSSPAIQFKGTGWYITDYARKGQAYSDSSASKSSDSKPAGESKSSESKAAAESTSTSTDKTTTDSGSKSTTKDKS
jgi:putative FmdB family regulatory protein